MWTAHLFQVVSGAIGPRLNFESVSWSIELNGTESISMKLPKSDLPDVDLSYWLSPWWAGIVLFYNGTPIVAGPIVSRPTEDSKSVSISCGGIRSVLARRLVTYELNDWSTLSKSVVSYKALSLGTIAKRVVAQAQQKQGGALPISFPIADQQGTDDADHERNYRGFNVQNINVDDVLTKLSNVIGGPDILFKPRLVRDNQLTFDMWHGTANQPRIYQDSTPVWDITPDAGQVSDVSTISTGSYQTSRTYAIGAGQDEGLLMKVNTNVAPIQKGYPLLETVVNDGNSENPDTVNGYGLSALMSNQEPLLEIQMTVRADGLIPLGKFWPGFLVEVIMKDWISLPDGKTPMRLLSISGDSSNNVKISLQKDA